MRCHCQLKYSQAKSFNLDKDYQATATFKCYEISSPYPQHKIIQNMIEIYLEFKAIPQGVVYQVSHEIWKLIAHTLQINSFKLADWIENLSNQDSLLQVFKFYKSEKFDLILKIADKFSVIPYARDGSADYQRPLAALKIINYLANAKWEWNERQYQKSFGEQIIQLVNQIPQPIKPEFESLFQFSSKKKNLYNKNVYSQQSFQDASIKQALVYHPTFTTQQMLQKILEKEYKMLLLYGQAGIGKSISISLIAILFSIVANFRLKQFQIYQLQAVMNQQQKALFHKIPLLLYFTFNLKGGNIRQFYDIIRRQLPCFIIKKTQPVNSILPLINEILKFYPKKQTIFVLDQINYYYSLIRKEIQHQEITQITSLLKDIMNPRQPQNIIFNSSENIQIFYNKKLNFNFRSINIFKYADYNIKGYKLGYEKRSICLSGLIELVHTIKFQYEKIFQKIKYSQKYEQINIQSLQKKMKLFFKQFLRDSIEKNYLKQQYLYLSQFTHERISKFINRQQKLIDQFQFTVQQDVHPKVYFEKIFQKLHFFIIQSEGRKYQNYVDQPIKPLHRYARYCQILSMRSIAQQLIASDQTQIDQYFDYNIEKSGGQLIQFSKQHTQIVYKPVNRYGKIEEERFLRIYYSPSTFLSITENILSRMIEDPQHLLQFVQLFSEISGSQNAQDSNYPYKFFRKHYITVPKQLSTLTDQSLENRLSQLQKLRIQLVRIDNININKLGKNYPYQYQQEQAWNKYNSIKDALQKELINRNNRRNQR